MVLECSMYAKHCFTRCRLLDLASELCRVHIDRRCHLVRVDELCKVNMALETHGSKGQHMPLVSAWSQCSDRDHPVGLAGANRRIRMVSDTGLIMPMWSADDNVSTRRSPGALGEQGGGQSSNHKASDIQVRLR